MSVYIDNFLLTVLINDKDQCVNFNKACHQAGVQLKQITLTRANLLYLLGYESIFKNRVQWNGHHPLYAHILEVLAQPLQDIAVYQNLFDQIFVDRLTQVKSWLPNDPSQLWQKLNHLKLVEPLKQWLTPSLIAFQAELHVNFHSTMHDLILYLAWSKVCTSMRALFDDQILIDQHAGLDVLKECLFESFSHITQTGHTQPSLLRLMEAAYAFAMRDEKLQAYPEEEWQILCKAVAVLRPEDELCNVLYIDELMHPLTEQNTVHVFTLDSVSKVQASSAFANYIVDKHMPTHSIQKLKVFCLTNQNEVLMLNSALKT